MNIKMLFTRFRLVVLFFLIGILLGFLIYPIYHSPVGDRYPIDTVIYAYVSKPEVLYFGIDNHVQIDFYGVNIIDVSFSEKTKKYQIQKNYEKNEILLTIKPERLGRLDVEIKIPNQITNKQIIKKSFSVRNLPNPELIINSNEDRMLYKDLLKTKTWIYCSIINIGYDLECPILNFDLIIIDQQHNLIKKLNCNSTFLYEQLYNIVKNGDRIIFENMQVKLPDGSIRYLQSHSFQIKQSQTQQDH